MRLAQLDRAFGYGPKGRGFESSNARYMCVYARFALGTQEALKNGHSCVFYFLNLGLIDVEYKPDNDASIRSAIVKYTDKSKDELMETMLNGECISRYTTPDDIFENIVGVIPDTGKTLEEYREERITERYGTVE